MSMKTEIKKLLSKGLKFGLTTDEYTSIRNNRYININLHRGEDIKNLGMIRIHGSMPADVAVGKVCNILKEFDIEVDNHISACVTVGASVMKKFGSLMNTNHQQCFSHGIHLAVCDVLYKKGSIISGEIYNEMDVMLSNDSIEYDEGNFSEDKSVKHCNSCNCHAF